MRIAFASFLLAALMLGACSKVPGDPTATVYQEPAEVTAVNDSLESLAVAKQGNITFEDFQAVFEHFLTKYPNSTLLHRDYQSAFDGYEKAQEKLAYYKHHFDANPNSAMAAYLYGRCLGGMETMTHFQKAVELDPKYYWGHFGLASAYLNGNPPDTAKAIAHYQQALAIDNSYPSSFAQLAQLYINRKDYAEALKYARAYGVTLPDDYRPVAVQAEILKAMNDLAGAEKTLVTFAQSHDKEERVRRELVDLYRNAARFDEALKYQHAIVGMTRRPADALVDLAKIYALNHLPDSALLYLNSAADQGYGDYRRLERNEALTSVRQLAGFPELIGRLRVASDNQRQARLAGVLANADSIRTLAINNPMNVPAPAWEFTNLEGKAVSLASLRGKVVVVDFWATWCGPCRMTMPLLQEFVERKPADVEFVSMNVWEDDTSKVRPYLADFGYTFNVLFGNNQIASIYEVSGIPTLVVIDKDGVIRYKHVGYDPAADQVLIWQTEELAKKQATT